LRIVVTVEARMRSTRLHGKVLKPILGRPSLEIMVERLKRAKHDEIVIATAVDPSCDPIEELAYKLKVGCYRGSEEDVLDRVLKAAREARADLIVEMTADCPIVDPATINQVIEPFYRDKDLDYVTTGLQHTFPTGMGAQGFPLSVLEEVARLTDDPVDHEHVSLFIYKHPELFKILNVCSDLPSHTADYRLTVDTPEDFELIKWIYGTLYPTNPNFTLRDVVNLLDRNQELAKLNSHIQQKKVR
jgi:spore coat polysaccharide biosynthesis protein SpsF